MSAVFFMATLAGIFALLFLAAITLCGRMNDRRAVDRDLSHHLHTRAETLREVAEEADAYNDPRNQDAIRSAVWAIEQRDKTRAAAGAVFRPVFEEEA